MYCTVHTVHYRTITLDGLMDRLPAKLSQKVGLLPWSCQVPASILLSPSSSIEGCSATDVITASFTRCDAEMRSRRSVHMQYEA